MSLSTCTQYPLPTPTLVFDTEQWDTTRSLLREYAVDAGLPCALYGIFVLLCGASIYSLVQPNTRNRRTTVLLGLTLLALFASTTIYTIGAFLFALENVYTQVLIASQYLWYITAPLNIDYVGGPSGSTGSPISTQVLFALCAPTATLTINILLGDAIVCWRACVLWRGNKIVIGVCVMLLLATFALGIVDTAYYFTAILGPSSGWQPDPHADGFGNFYEGFSYGIAATALTLSTNLFATMAAAMKAWQSRRVLKRYVVIGSKVSQMEKVISLLVESGAIYCALWVVVLAWQVGIYNPNLPWTWGDNSFWDIFGVIMNGALVPIIAIYPTIIIVLVALDHSHMENGFTNRGDLDLEAAGITQVEPQA